MNMKYFVASFSLGVIASHTFVIYFVKWFFTSTNNASKYSGVNLHTLLPPLNRLQKGIYT